MKLRAITDLFTGPTLPKPAMPAPLAPVWQFCAAIVAVGLLNWPGDLPYRLLHEVNQLAYHVGGPIIRGVVVRTLLHHSSELSFGVWLGCWLGVAWRRCAASDELHVLPDASAAIRLTSIRALAFGFCVMLSLQLAQKLIAGWLVSNQIPEGHDMAFWDRTMVLLVGGNFGAVQHFNPFLPDTAPTRFLAILHTVTVYAIPLLATIGGSMVGRKAWHSILVGFVAGTSIPILAGLLGEWILKLATVQGEDHFLVSSLDEAMQMGGETTLHVWAARAVIWLQTFVCVGILASVAMRRGIADASRQRQ